MSLLRSQLSKLAPVEARRSFSWRCLSSWRGEPRVLGSLLGLACVTTVLPALAETPLRHATGLRVSENAALNETEITVQFTGTPAYIARFSDEKRRLIIDVMDSDVRGIAPTYGRPTGIVKSILTQAFDGGGAKTTRLLVSLERAGQAVIRVDSQKLLITLSDAEEQPAPPVVVPAPSADSPAAIAPAPSADSAASRAVPAGAAPKPGPALGPTVTDVAFERRDNSDWIKIRVTDYAAYEEQHPSPGRSRLLIRGAALTAELARTLDVRAFGGDIETIASSYDTQQRAVVIDVERRRDKTKSFVSEQDGQLSWSFFEPGSLHSSLTGVGSDGGIARKARTLHVDPSVSAGLPEVESGGRTELARQPLQAEQTQQSEEAAGFGPTILGQQNGYTGRRIDLDLKDADVHNVLRLLADVGQVNIVTADNVGGSVTIKMRNVAWDQALDVVLQSKGLGMVRGGNIIRVAPLPQLEKEREMAIARRRQELQLAPIETRLIPVSYASAEEIQSRAREVLSGRGSIAVDERTNVLIARDVSGTLDQVEELVRSLDTQTPQVLVEARIVEATSRYLRDLGIQWGGDASFSNSTGNPTGLAFPSSVGLTGGASDNDTPTAGLSPFQAGVQNPNFAVNLPATVGTGSGGAIGLTLGSVDNNFNLNLRLSAAEQTGMVRILSSPRILTLDNHEARISQGTLIPFSQVSAQGVQTTFQEAKLQLLVQPHVTADGSVSMHVKINRDEPDFNQTSARGDPTILKREAETDLLVMDGHTAVIGGIYTRNTGRNIDQVPFFGDIPLLGLLFQRRRSTDQRGELVIFLTPRIVNRAQALGR